MTNISQAYPDRVEVRGRDLTGDLMGRLSFTEYFHLLLTGDEPTDDQRYFLDLLLVAIAEHGMMPTNVAARMTLAADPDSLQGAVAAGILGAGTVVLGTSEACARLLERRARAARPRRPSRARSARRAASSRASATPCTSRSTRAPSGSSSSPTQRGVSGEYVALARQFRDGAEAAWGRPLTMNVSMPIAAVMLDLGFSSATVKAVPDPRADGQPARPPGRGAAAPDRLPDGGSRRGGDRVRAMSDASSYRTQIDYLLERSRVLSREAAVQVRVRGGRPRGDRRSCRSPRSSEIRAIGHAENPIGAHLCVEPCRDRPHLLHERHDRHAELHPADRARPRELGHRLGAQLRRLRRRGGPADRLHLQRRPVRGRRRARVVRPPRPRAHPGRHRQHRAADPGDRAARARGRRAHAVVRRLPRRVGRGPRLRPARLERASACSSPASPAAASRPSARSSRRAGARASPRRWGSATSASRCGASASTRTACTSAPAASSTRS